MDDNTTGRVKRVRIGLTLATDVAEILAKYATEEQPRYKIIEEAVRAWERERGRLNMPGAAVPIRATDTAAQGSREAPRRLRSEDKAQTYCPRHRPKYCEPSCPYRVVA
jgi:hypothetical protein